MNRNKYGLILILVIVAILWGDEMWITWRFHQLCKDAGVHVYQKVEVEGFYNDVMPGGRELIEKYGYRFMEQKSNWEEQILHIEKHPDGFWISDYIEQPTARYHYKYSANNEGMGLQLAKQEWVIVDSETGEILGRDTTFKRYPGWINGLWLRATMGVYPTICMGSAPKPPELRHLLYHYILIPTNKN